jgi:hypothetical protein
MDKELKGHLDQMEGDFHEVAVWTRETCDVVAAIANAMVGGYKNATSCGELDEFVYELESALRARLVD